MEMANTDKLFENLRHLLETNPQGINIAEEQIDLDLQQNYYRRSAKLCKQVFDLQDVIAKVPLLYDFDTRLEEKRDILIQLASFDDVEAFRIIEKFKKEAVGEIKLWASMAYVESKANMEGTLLDEPQVIISTGLGGKGTKLRYFVCLIKKDLVSFEHNELRTIQGEFENVIEDYNAEIESITIGNHIYKLYLLVPMTTSPADVVNPVVQACEKYGNFLDETVIISNVCEMTDDEIDDVVRNKHEGLIDIADIEDDSDSDDEDEEDDDNDDEF